MDTVSLYQRARAAFSTFRSYPSPQPMTFESFARELGIYDQNLAGITVTEHSALNYSPVWCGVATLSRDCAKLPLVHYRNLPNGGKEPFKSHRLYKILHDEPNPEMTSFKFRETMVALCILYGNSYAEIVRDDAGRVAGMYLIVPSRVTPIRDPETGQLWYRVSQPSGGQALVRLGNMIHFSSLSTDGVIGHGLVEHAHESIGLGMATEKFGAAFFGNGSTFGGVVEVPGLLNETTKDNVRTAIEAVHRGVERAHKILVLAGGSKFTQRGTSPNEGQYTETRKFQIAEVARWLGMPNHKLGDLENAHFTNIEEQEIQYYVGCVSGWTEMIEQELTRKLISPLEYAQQTIEHNLKGVMRGDSTKRADYYAKMFSIGVFSQNDILRLENMNPIDESGDAHLVPLNMIPIERYDEWIDAQLQAKTAPPPVPAAPVKPNPDGTDPTLAPSQQNALLLAAEMRAAALQAERDTEVAARARADAEAQRLAEKAEQWTREAAEAQVRATAASERALLSAAEATEQAASREAEATARAAAEAEARTLAERTAAAEGARAAAEARTLEQAAALTVAETRVTEQAREVEQAAAARIAAEARTAEETARAVTSEQAAERLRADIAATGAELVERGAALEAAQTRVTEITREVEQAQAAVVAAEARIALEAGRATTAEEAAEAIRTTAAATAAELAARVAALATAEADLLVARNALSETEVATSARRTAELNRLTNVIGAHRALIVDAVGRMIRRETGRARLHQATTSKLEKWAEAFYVTHVDECVTAFLPAIRTHLSWKQSLNDPGVVALEMAREHSQRSLSELRAVINGSEPEEFPMALDRLLHQWETDRPQAIADEILRDEITHVRSL